MHGTKVEYQQAAAVHSSQDYLQARNNLSCGGCGSVFAHAQLSCFYLPYPHVVSFTRPSSRLISQVKGQMRGGPGDEATFVFVFVLHLWAINFHATANENFEVRFPFHLEKYIVGGKFMVCFVRGIAEIYEFSIGIYCTSWGKGHCTCQIKFRVYCHRICVIMLLSAGCTASS